MSLNFKLNYTDDFEKVVEIEGCEEPFREWTALASVLSDVPQKSRDGDQRSTWLLAQAYEHLSDYNQTLVLTEEKFAKEIEDWAEPEIGKLRRWYAGETISAPPMSSITGPVWDGNDLILHFYNFDWGGSSRYLFVSKHRLSFGDSWTVERENLDGQEPLELTRTSARAEELFGGKVGGFLKAKPPLCKERLYLAVDREGDAVPYVWWPEGSEPKRFASFEAMSSEHPEANDGKLLACLGDEIERYWGDRGIRHCNYSAIADGAAYLEEYRSKNLGTFKLRYWVDQLATWTLEVPELDSVSSPIVKDDVLTVYFKGEKYQPCRMVIDLTTLTLAENPKIETMATEKLVSDTGGYHGKPLRPYESPEISILERPKRISDVPFEDERLLPPEPDFEDDIEPLA